MHARPLGGQTRLQATQQVIVVATSDTFPKPPSAYSSPPCHGQQWNRW